MEFRRRLVHFARKLSLMPFMAKVVRWMIINFNSLLLGEKLFQTENVFVVRHPKPSYPIHLLVLPKQPISSVTELSLVSDFWDQIPEVVTALVKTYIPDGDGYRIIINGGAYQEIPILHIHFISGESNE